MPITYWGINAPVCGIAARQFWSTEGGALVGEVKTMADIVTPNFHKLQAKGHLIFNPMHSRSDESAIVEAGHGYTRKQFPTPACVISGQSYFSGMEIDGPYLAKGLNVGVVKALPTPDMTLLTAKEESDLVTEISTKVLADRGSGTSNLFESVAEYKQTLNMFRKPLKGLFRFFHKNGRRMKLMGPAEAWLTYRYGIKPLISDIEMIVVGLKKNVGLQRQTTRAKGEIHKQSVASSNFSDAWARTNWSRITSDDLVVRGMAIDEYVASVASNIGFGWKNLSTVPWELLPFSFVLDWFVSLGDFLKAYAPSPGYKMLGSCVTIDRTISAMWTATSTTQIGGNIITVPTVGTCTSTVRLRSRGVLGAPGLVVRSDFRFSSLNRVADSLALISVLAASYFSAPTIPSGKALR
jgi:hypothetical protein